MKQQILITLFFLAISEIMPAGLMAQSDTGYSVSNGAIAGHNTGRCNNRPLYINKTNTGAIRQRAIWHEIPETGKLKSFIPKCWRRSKRAILINCGFRRKDIQAPGVNRAVTFGFIQIHGNMKFSRISDWFTWIWVLPDSRDKLS